MFLFVLSLVRAFLPISIFFSNAQPRRYTSPFFKEDYFPTIFNSFLGLTNGFVSTLAMMSAPRFKVFDF